MLSKVLKKIIIIQMKILIVINNLGVGGAERLVIDDVNEMLERGLDVSLLTLKPEKEGKSLSQQCKISPLKWIEIDFGNLFNFGSWWRVFGQIKKIKPDIIISHLWYANTIFKIVSKICGVKLITFEHNVYDTLKTRKMFLIDKLTQNIPSKIVAVSNAVKDSLLRHGIEEKRIEVVLNGIDTSKYENQIKKDEKENVFTFIFIGRLIYQKGVDILLKAFKNVENARLLLVGDGVNRDEFINLSKELNIQNKAHFLGTRQDIPELLQTSDCFVLPSRYEGLPMVLLEAIAARKAIIVSDFQSASELIQNNINGIIVPKENIETLSYALSKISTDSSFRQSLESEISKISYTVSIKNHVDHILALV